MESNRNSQYVGSLLIRKSLPLLFIKLMAIEIISGLIYLIVTIGLRYVDVQFDVNFSVTTFGLGKSLLFVMFEIIVTGYLFLLWGNTYYILTSDEIKYVSGIISRKEMTFSLKNIQSVSFSQGLIGMILNYGNIKIFNPALQQELLITYVSSPRQIVENIKRLLEDDSGNRFIMKK